MNKKQYKTLDNCIACGVYTENGNCLHHVKYRGSGGSDESYNLMPLCFKCHTEIHMIGLNTMSNNNENIITWLVNNDWVYDIHLGKWLNLH